MKLLMILAGLLMSAQAYSLSWEEVKANPARYRIESPGTYYNVGAYKRFVDFDGDVTTCVAGDQIYGGTIQKCMASGGGDDNYDRWNCPKGKLQTFQLYKDIKGTRTICMDNDDDNGSQCENPKTLPYEIDTNVKVLIFKKGSFDDDDHLTESHPAYVGHVRIQLPSCK